MNNTNNKTKTVSKTNKAKSTVKNTDKDTKTTEAVQPKEIIQETNSPKKMPEFKALGVWIDNEWVK